MTWKRQRLLRVWTTEEDAKWFRRRALDEEIPYGELLHRMRVIYEEKLGPYKPEMSIG